MQNIPASIAKSEHFQVGSLIWVRNNGHFIKYKLISVFQELKRFEIQDINTPQKKFSVEQKHCYNIDPALNQSTHSYIQELPSLSILNEPNILESLSQLYNNSNIYSRMGEVLISLNPFHEMPHLYSKATHQMYSSNKLLLKCPPHPFSVAQKAFRALRNQSGSKKAQSIIVTGISGSGKTENTKLIINYLVERTQQYQSQLSKMLLLVNPVLQAFGNAQSANNENSSRFGKLIKIYYEEVKGSMQITGAQVDTSLLEGFRVTSLNSEVERNFHIFYLVASKNSQMQNLKYIRNCNFTSNQVERMSQKLQQLKDSMNEIGISQELQMEIFEVVQGISWLGEIEFVDESSSNKQNICENIFQEAKSKRFVVEDSSSIRSLEPVKKAALCLQLDYMDLKNYLLQTEMNVGGKNVEKIKKKRHLLGSIAARDALAKQLYLRLFQHIVNEINKSLKKVCSKNFSKIVEQKKEPLSIQSKQLINVCNNPLIVLDIYGFQDLEKNSLEQLCINYTNEQLHDFSLQSTVGGKLQLFKEQGVNQNLANCNIVKKENAIKDLCKLMDLIDDQNKLNKIQTRACDLSNILITTLRSRYLSSSQKLNQIQSQNHKLSNSLVIDHYAGTTCYSTEQWVIKNAYLDFNGNQLSKKLLVSSQMTLVKQLSIDQNELQVEIYEQKPKTKQPKFHTFTMEFRAQFSHLMEAIRDSQHYFIFCLKPNMDQEAQIIDRKLVLQQLNASGLISLAKLYGSPQSNFPVQAQISSFYRSNQAIMKILPERWTKSKSSKECLSILLDAFGFVQFKDYVMGTTLIFMNSQNALFIEKIRSSECQFELQSELIEIIERKTNRLLLRKVIRGVRVCSIIWKSIRAQRARRAWRQMAGNLLAKKIRKDILKTISQVASVRKMQNISMRLSVRSSFKRILISVQRKKMFKRKLSYLQSLLTFKNLYNRFNQMKEFNTTVFERAKVVLGNKLFEKRFDNPRVINQQFINSLESVKEFKQGFYFDRQSSSVFRDDKLLLQNVAAFSFNPKNQNICVVSKGDLIEIIRVEGNSIYKLGWKSCDSNQEQRLLIDGFAFEMNWINEISFEIQYIPQKTGQQDASQIKVMKFDLIEWNFV